MTGRPYRFTLSRTFSANDMYGNKTRHWDPVARKWCGGRFRTGAYNTWRERAGREIIAQGHRPQFAGAVKVSVEIGTSFLAGDAVYPIAEKFDADNTLKPICDLLSRLGIVADDTWRHIPEHEIRITPDVIGAVVTVYPLGYALEGKGEHVRKVVTHG